MFVLDTEACRAWAIEGQAEDTSYGQPQWTPEEGLLMVRPRLHCCVRRHVRRLCCCHATAVLKLHHRRAFVGPRMPRYQKITSFHQHRMLSSLAVRGDLGREVSRWWLRHQAGLLSVQAQGHTAATAHHRR